MKQNQASRIGGEFELDLSLLKREIISGEASRPTFHMPHELWVDSGRAALAVALDQARALGASGRAWLPNYLCESVLNVFKARAFSISFYDVSEELICAPPSTLLKAGDIVLFIHYFGASNDSALEWIGELPDGVWVIEDAVQRPVFGRAFPRSDFMLTSLRKFTPQPDGALLGSRHRLDQVTLDEASERFVSSRALGKLLRGGDGQESAFLQLFEQSEALLDNELAIRKISALSRFLMERTDFSAAANIRLENEKILRAALRTLEGVTPLIDDFREQSPLGFPITVSPGRRNEVRHHMAREGIFCPVHWPVEGHALSQKILTLPLDQRYGAKDMKRIADTLQRALRKS